MKSSINFFCLCHDLSNRLPKAIKKDNCSSDSRINRALCAFVSLHRSVALKCCVSLYDLIVFGSVAYKPQNLNYNKISQRTNLPMTNKRTEQSIDNRIHTFGAVHAHGVRTNGTHYKLNSCYCR